jgi:hypothetical protein
MITKGILIGYLMVRRIVNLRKDSIAEDDEAKYGALDEVEMNEVEADKEEAELDADDVELDKEELSQAGLDEVALDEDDGEPRDEDEEEPQLGLRLLEVINPGMALARAHNELERCLECGRVLVKGWALWDLRMAIGVLIGMPVGLFGWALFAGAAHYLALARTIKELSETAGVV